ncbi:unnamed protein product [Microthlaspi erraticum]|uniref:Uncharacterized protein n=1 Tax=Microthlaspi erraticum TaxID=1685480 RepID=A0A6D2IP47_9BRAS|nr:unnamed protein product [Microthlaspi erraticum]
MTNIPPESGSGESTVEDPLDELLTRIDQIERTVRLMVPDLMDRMRKSQRGFDVRVYEDWVSSYRGKKQMKRLRQLRRLWMRLRGERMRDEINIKKFLFSFILL